MEHNPLRHSAADGGSQDLPGLLERAEITTCSALPRGSNYTFLVEMRAETGAILCGVYKPKDGEAPLWDFPSGTLYKRERAAYIVAETLGWHFIPPTVLRNGPQGVGSVQQFIEHDPQNHYFLLKDKHAAEFRRMCAFDWLTNNADRKAGHCLLGPDDHVWGIDHGLTFNAAPKLCTVIWDFADQPITDDILKDLEAFGATLQTLDGAITELPQLLSPSEISALKQRLELILARKRFPGQHEGRVPWPWL
ncbi:MAG: hypothetical protein EXR67_05400 [Dehalococcoidia bacterium]|nr:hypothetical protein [Dehalococcoidia bacterium]